MIEADISLWGNIKTILSVVGILVLFGGTFALLIVWFSGEQNGDK